MGQIGQDTRGNSSRSCYRLISRRAAVGTTGLLLLGSFRCDAIALSQEDAAKQARERAREATDARFNQAKEHMDAQQRAFMEQVQNARSPEEQRKVMLDWQLRQTLERLKKDLGVPPEEWAVLQPRIVAIYRLMHADALPQESKGPLALVTQRTQELWDLLRKNSPKPEEIKERLSALRAAKEQVRQELIKARLELSKILTLQQEAWLVLAGLLE